MADDDGTVAATDAKDRIMVILKGITVLAALTLLPNSVALEDDGDQFKSQVVYAFATNVGGVLDPLRASRLFPIISFAVIVTFPHIRQWITSTKHTARLYPLMCDVANLVFFDAFTSVAFAPSGDEVCDIAIILGIFGLLWKFQAVSPDLQNIQQFITWRTASFVSAILQKFGLQGHTLAILVFAASSLTTFTRTSGQPAMPWLDDLAFLVGLNGVISDVSLYVKSIGDAQGLPVLFGVIIIVATANQMCPRPTS